MMPANANIKLRADGLSRARAAPRRAGTVVSGDRAAAATRRREAHVALDRHPRPARRPGPDASWRRSLASCAVGVGLLVAGSGRKQRGKARLRDAKRTREALLEELAELERAHTSGQVGPRTYERARRELIEALAYTLAAAASRLCTRGPDSGLWAT